MRVLTHIALLLVLLMYSAGLPIVSHYCHHAQQGDVGLWIAGDHCSHHGNDSDEDAHPHAQLPACCVKQTPEAVQAGHESDDCCDTDGTFFKLPDYEHSAFAKVFAPVVLYVGWVNYDSEPLARLARADEYVRPPPDVGWTVGSVNDRLAQIALWLL